MAIAPFSGLATFLNQEKALIVSVATAVVFVVYGGHWFDDLTHTGTASILFVWLFAVIMASAFAVVRHADCLAARLGEPYGTLILTLSVISIEVMMIAAVMVTGGDKPTLARDTMYAVIMIALNGMVGVTLLLGACVTASNSTTCRVRMPFSPLSSRWRFSDSCFPTTRTRPKTRLSLWIRRLS